MQAAARRILMTALLFEDYFDCDAAWAVSVVPTEFIAA